MKYSREHPSPRYRHLVNNYRFMHTQGFTRRVEGEEIFTPPEKTYPGYELPRFAQPIKKVLRGAGARSVLDYGSGKGQQYQLEVKTQLEKYPNIQSYWDVDEIVCFDPAVPGIDKRPNKKFDAVVTTSVMEHVPTGDIAWVVDDLFSYAKKFVFACINCEPTQIILPNGENANCTVQSPEWWDNMFGKAAAKTNGLIYLLALSIKHNVTGRQGIVWKSNVLFH